MLGNLLRLNANDLVVVVCSRAHGAFPFDMIIVPEATNMPVTTMRGRRYYVKSNMTRQIGEGKIAQRLEAEPLV